MNKNVSSSSSKSEVEAPNFTVTKQKVEALTEDC